MPLKDPRSALSTLNGGPGCMRLVCGKHIDEKELNLVCLRILDTIQIQHS